MLQMLQRPSLDERLHQALDALREGIHPAAFGAIHNAWTLEFADENELGTGMRLQHKGPGLKQQINALARDHGAHHQDAWRLQRHGQAPTQPRKLIRLTGVEAFEIHAMTNDLNA